MKTQKSIIWLGGGVLLLVALLIGFSRHSMIGILWTQNNTPIVFYGRLTDQFGNPVAGAEVTGSTINTINYTGFTAGGNRCTTTSDSNGLFKLDCGKGDSLGFMPRKFGYALASLNTSGWHSQLKAESERQHPDPDKPVLIKMWKLQGAEPLFGINERFKLLYTNAPLNFDLLTGKMVSIGGDIRITVARPPGIISEQHPQGWGVKIEGVDGGVLDSEGTERITYFAPENGYQPDRTIRSSDKPPEMGIGGFHRGLYVKSRNGQIYSKLSVDFGINRDTNDPINIIFQGIANTNSSRNWEGAPNTYK